MQEHKVHWKISPLKEKVRRMWEEIPNRRIMLQHHTLINCCAGLVGQAAEKRSLASWP